MRIKNHILIAAFMGLFLSSYVAAQEPDWQDYAQLLATTVKPGDKHGVPLAIVDYAALKQSGAIEAIYQQLASFPVASLNGKDETLAFYINTYNILAIKIVVDHWPVDSIKDIGHFFRPVWGKDAGRIGGETVSLDDIENNFIRPLGEPRIHLAIVCASVSCPDLRKEPYTAEKINQQLDEQTTAFLQNKKKGLYIKDNEVHISKIFSWFAKDFKAVGGVSAFIRHYYPGLSVKNTIEADINYDWAVNSLLQ